MSRFSTELDRYIAGEISEEDLLRWVYMNITRYDSRKAALSRYPILEMNPEADALIAEIYRNPEPDTVDEVRTVTDDKFALRPIAEKPRCALVAAHAADPNTNMEQSIRDAMTLPRPRHSA